MDTIPIYIEALRRGDLAFDKIELDQRQYTDDDLSELLDCLITRPNVIKSVSLEANCLSDVSGVKLAQYVSISTKLKNLYIAGNPFTDKTFLALATALYVNTSLRTIWAWDNLAWDVHRIDTAFTVALRLNPVRPALSGWRFYSLANANGGLKYLAENSTPPSMLEFLLCIHSNF